MREPYDDIGKDLSQGPDDGFEIFFGKFINRQPLADEAAGVKMLRREPEVLDRIQIAGSAEPRMDRIGRDDIELLLRGQQEIPAVVEYDLQLRVIQDIVVVNTERPCHAEHFRFDFCKSYLFYARMCRGRTQRHSAPRPEHEYFLRILVEQHRQVA